MKSCFIFSYGAAAIFASIDPVVNKQDALEGAWEFSYEGQDFVMLLQDGYRMFTQYSLSGKKFVLTSRWPLCTADGKVKIKTEFNSADKSDVGKFHG